MKRYARWLLTALVLGVLVLYVRRSSAEFVVLYAQLDRDMFFLLLAPLLGVSAVAPAVNGRISRDLVARFGVLLGPWEAYALALVNSFGNLVPMPQAGALARGLYLKRIHKLDYGAYAATLAVTYVSSLTLIGISGLLALFGLWARDQRAGAELWIGFGLLACTGLLFSPWTQRVPLPSRLAGFRDGLRSIGDQHVLARVVALQLVIIALSATGLWLSATAVASRAHVSWLDGLMLGLVSVVAAIANVFGIEQVAAMGTAALLGIDANVGLAASALYRLSAIAVVLALGPVAMRSLDQRAQAAPPRA
jgi:hypothetical protein